ncbi:MAG: MarR family transcriptional regulator [Thermoleophilia bacterium]|nr:MarR family transcriptional regulator [Thermoleophilia bacterium]
MERQTGTEPHVDRSPSYPAARPVSPGQKHATDLDAGQRLVLDCLRTAGTGLTIAQLESRLSLPHGSLQTTMETLVHQRLVARLNTVVPSFCLREAEPGVDAG